MTNPISTAQQQENLIKDINYILDDLYRKESSLFGNNLCERCLVFRFAHHLQNKLGGGYYVDCDYNSSTYYDKESGQWKKRGGKPINDQANGKITKRFIDIIVHKREVSSDSDFICFEIKKWNNCTKEGVKKDVNNLKVLTKEYGYEFGFHLIFGETKEETKISVFHNGKKLND